MTDVLGRIRIINAISRIAADAKTHRHAVQADYQERLDAGDTEEVALDVVARKYADRAARQRRIDARPRRSK